MTSQAPLCYGLQIMWNDDSFYTSIWYPDRESAMKDLLMLRGNPDNQEFRYLAEATFPTVIAMHHIKLVRLVTDAFAVPSPVEVLDSK